MKLITTHLHNTLINCTNTETGNNDQQSSHKRINNILNQHEIVDIEPVIHMETNKIPSIEESEIKPKTSNDASHFITQISKNTSNTNTNTNPCMTENLDHSIHAHVTPNILKSDYIAYINAVLLKRIMKMKL